MRHRSLAALSLLALASVAARADETDLRSDACRDALRALQAREAALGGAAPPQAASAPTARPDAKPRLAGDRTWQALRARAAQACLGGAPDAPRPLPHSALPPIAVPPVAVEPTPLRVPSPPPPAIEPRRPSPTVTSCDAGGCWMSDGSRMPQAGRNPLDPKVRCTVQGAFVLCQ